MVTQFYLRWRYQIKSLDGDSEIPTCDYVWPNGHGDVGKFLEGFEKSESWREEYGGVFRIWSGMSQEM